MERLIIIFVIYLVLYSIFKKISSQARKQRQQAAPAPPVTADDEDEEERPEAVSPAPAGSSIFEQVFGVQQTRDELKKMVRARKKAAEPPAPPSPPPPPREAEISPRPRPVVRPKPVMARKPFYRSLNPAKLKEGIVLSEILGPCMANRKAGSGKYF